MLTSKDNMVENRVPKSVFRSKLQYDESTGNLVWIGDKFTLVYIPISLKHAVLERHLN